MLHQHLNRRSFRRIGWGMLAAAMCLLLGGARAQGEPIRAQAPTEARACEVAYQSGQEKEQSGRLVEASQLFAKCSDETCGVPLWHDCIMRGTRLSSALPSVVPLVVDERGDPRVDVQVEMDGRVIASQLNGRAIPIDPGTHEFSFSTPAGVFASQSVTIARGERNRALAVSFPDGAKIRLSSSAKARK